MGGGGGHHPPHPKWVWTPSGGWAWQDTWQPGLQGAHNTKWKRNTGLAFFAAGLMVSYIWKVSTGIEDRPQAPYRKIPSIHWWGRQELRDKYPNPQIPGDTHH